MARNLDAADQERALLKNELHGLARALSPLKKEVCEVVKKQNIQRDNNNNSNNIENNNNENNNNENNNNNTNNNNSDNKDQTTPPQQPSSDSENEASLDLPDEVNRMKEDLSVFNEEKSALEIEQDRLETRLKEIGDEKEDLRSKLRELIQVTFFLHIFHILKFQSNVKDHIVLKLVLGGFLIISKYRNKKY